MLSDLVASGDAEIDATFTDKGGDICCGEEDKGNVEVGDEGDVKTVLAPKLDG